MSEKIYALLLRLFPSHFRKAYGDEALQLFRDRDRDENGFIPRFRLWFDLLADLAISVPREYFYADPQLLAASGQRLGCTPSFYFLGDESPRPGALFLGGMLSLVALFTFSSLLSQGGNHRPRNSSARQLRRGTVPSASAYKRPAPQAAGDTSSTSGGENETLAPTSGHPTMVSTPFTPAEGKPGKSSSDAILLYDPSHTGQSSSSGQRDTGSPMQPTPGDAATTVATAVGHGNLDAAERQRVVNAAIANLKQHYVYPDMAQKMAEALLVKEKRGEYDAITDGDIFAHQLTKQMRDVSHDMHLELVYSQDPLPPQPAGQTAEGLARYRDAMKQENCTFEKVEILPHNIGYLKLNFFPDRSVCEQTATAAMASLNNTDALIVDLRDNRGGMPDMVALMASYFFDHPEYFFNPRENTTTESWTHSPVPGNKLADKPVYVLTSSRTFSGAEQFCYDLKMLKRVTLVGETTGGGAHSGVWHRIDDHFGMGIPETKPINPYATPDWEGTGVEPDVRVKAADALAVAENLAQSKLQKK
ncbi:MAG TPA: S41 family peptidase [Candidatus Acidoferrum sp.]|nr:S41 family peptidase [Candidatus Acidoferrum sp.]